MNSIAIDAASLGELSRPSRRRTLDTSSLGYVFGIDLDVSPSAMDGEPTVESPGPIRPGKNVSPVPKKSPIARKKLPLPAKPPPGRNPLPFC